MLRIPLLLLAAITAAAADDPWGKVRELKSGTELRIYKKGAKLPILAKFDEATEDKLRIATKNEQLAIAKEDIDRIDYRPAQPGGRVTRQTRTTTDDPAAARPVPGTPGSRPGPSSSSSTSLSVGSKPDFETIYRRPAVAAPQK